MPVRDYAKEQAEFDEREKLRRELEAQNTPLLPPHNPDATCPKCGADAMRIPVEYHNRSGVTLEFIGYFPKEPCRDKYLGEHLCRICGRCGYPWQEQVIPQDQPRQPETDQP